MSYLLLLRRKGDAVRRAAPLLAELHLHLQQHVPPRGEAGLHAGPALQRLVVSNSITCSKRLKLLKCTYINIVRVPKRAVFHKTF